MTPSPRLAAVLLLVSTAAPAGRSFADVAMTAQEVGSDVVFNYAGSIDLTGLVSGVSSQIRGLVYPVNSLVEFGPVASVPDAAYAYNFVVNNTTAPANIGGGGARVITSFSGSYFSIHRNSIKLPPSYVSGNTITGTMRLAGTSFASMGLAASEDAYVWTLTNGEEVTLSFLDPIAGKPSNTALKKSLLQKVKNLQKQIQSARKRGNAAVVKRLAVKVKAIRARIRKL